jgi:predicted transcriptional regulator
MPLKDGGSTTMSRSRNYPYSMTLRLSSPMQSELENLAFDRHVSKAGFIRRCIRQGIADAYRHGTQDTQNQGAL